MGVGDGNGNAWLENYPPVTLINLLEILAAR
jgi:hypothetical protein